jgi:hypothetical protein
VAAPADSEDGGTRRICLVTSIDDDEPFKWGLSLDKVTLPMVLFHRANLLPLMRERGVSAAVTLVESARDEPPSFAQKLAMLDAARAAQRAADAYYWVDVRMLYQHFSFAFLSCDVLPRALRGWGDALGYCRMPGHTAEAFFGGPAPALERLRVSAERAPETLFEPMRGEVPADAPFRIVFGRDGYEDLNLNLVGAIDAPIVHVIGDSHVYNCFTPNAAIGCRNHVLVSERDVAPTPTRYAYQFSHHLGGRTMHHAGAPGELLAVARDCAVRDGDAVVWVFGEIDVRCHILKQHVEQQRALDEVIETLARAYIRSVLEVARFYPATTHVVFAPIPPLDNPNYSSATLPVFGSIEERVAATRQVRDVLRGLCERHALRYLEAPKVFETERGDLRWELSDQFCHIARADQGPVLDALYALLAR